ncbi:hypothetical protein DEB41_04595 [Vibrio anguillarum]|uniref:Uncharacterized protein n=3 Tax=Vibrio TaxID=662 RepID=A0A241PSC5_VIBAN|nr:hypothetical protein CEA93_10885 [Vibrio anguillarum]ASU22821.1 hypothetical protein CCZ37_09585 [Vibrio qinghaiensis]MDF9388531.1 hypothetical protein [Vibrio sp. 1151_11]MDQ2191450.1 hypothetical protein [Vibrio sp. A14(2019)]MDQ2197167.1 hypothetical protein [Vibrio sp. 2017_1457_11]NAW89999.1 hypothetical protein [Vibrio sp. V24_P1S3T111]NAW98642.1 hypothetical protein [Vibrio sp. V23_P3S9T160]NAX18550.1 hypothetical protein [Vibrio sp. V22_P2S10T140]NAX43432.1 hypothetical protein [
MVIVCSPSEFASFLRSGQLYSHLEALTVNLLNPLFADLKTCCINSDIDNSISMPTFKTSDIKINILCFLIT